MIDWLAFLEVLVASIVGACGIVLLFSLGLRFVDAESTGSEGDESEVPRWRRPVGIGFFVLCGLLILFGLYLIIPFFHR